MGCHVTIVTGKGERHEFELHDADLAGMDARKAQEWLGQEFEAAGCAPARQTPLCLPSLELESKASTSSLAWPARSRVV